jgi:heat shock protein HslJ
VLAAALLGGCARTGSQVPPAVATPSVEVSQDSLMPPEVRGVMWQWVSLTTPTEQVTVDAPERYTIRFDSVGRVAVRADCNQGSGTYAVRGDRRLELGPLALTKVACAPGSLSERFAREVGRATSFSVKDGELFLELPVGSGTLRFRRQP